MTNDKYPRRGPFIVVLAILLAAALALAIVGTGGCDDSGEDAESTSSSTMIPYSSPRNGYAIDRDPRFETVSPTEAPRLEFRDNFIDIDNRVPGQAPDQLSVAGINERRRARNTAAGDRPAVLKKIVTDLGRETGSTLGDWRFSTINGLPAAWLMSTNPQTRAGRLTCIIVGENDIYVLTGDSSADSWEANQKAFAEAFESFREI